MSSNDKWESLKKTVNDDIESKHYDSAVDALVDLNEYIISGTFDFIRDQLAELLDKSPEHFTSALERINCSILNMSQIPLVLDNQDDFSDEIVQRIKYLDVLDAHISSNEPTI